jgi:hypothetical protein
MTNEEKQELAEFQKIQKFFSKNINSDKWDYVAEKLPDAHISIISQIMKADDPKKVNWLVLRNAYYVIDRIKELKKGERK